jgi:hypothetical protein
MIMNLMQKKSANSPSTSIFKAVNKFKTQDDRPSSVETKERGAREEAMVVAKEARAGLFASLASALLGHELVAEFQVAAATRTERKTGVAARLKERKKMDAAKEVMPAVVRDLEDKVEISIFNRMHYRKFVFGFMWLFFHFAVLLNINGTLDKFAVKDSVIRFIDVSAGAKLGMSDFPASFYEWLDDRASHLWTDPFCGNGICEAPYEFPAYETLGCEADCALVRVSW